MTKDEPPLFSSERFLHDKTLETYKSMIAYTQSGMNMALVANGAGVISLLTLVGHIASGDKGKPLVVVSVPHLKIVLLAFCLGVALAAFSTVSAYLAQRATFVHNTGYGNRASVRVNPVWGIATVLLVFLSMISFCAGATYAALYMLLPSA